MAIEVYKRREPDKTDLYEIVRANLANFIATTEAADRPLPPHVIDELQAYLRCGILAHGFARVRCPDCGFDRLVAFSCKGRGFCPSCYGRHMAQGAAHLVDHVIPQVPMRHWVLSLPPPLRYMLAYDKSLCSEVLAAFIKSVTNWLRQTAKRELDLASVTHAHPGSVTVIQRCSSNLALNVHFHSLVTDGVFVQSEPDAKPVFRALRAPTKAEVAQVAWDACKRTLDILRKRDLWLDVDPADDPLAQDEPGMAEIYSASIQGTLAFGPNAGQRVMRFCAEGAGNDNARAGVAQIPGYGFNLHAKARVAASDRKGLEKLCRYILRPPIAQDRLTLRPDGMVCLELKRAFSDGTTHVLFEPLDFIGKLAALVPPKRMHRTRFHGVFSSHAKLRAQVVPELSRDTDTGSATAPAAATAAQGSQTNDAAVDDCTHRRRLGWAKLMARVFGIDVLECPKCKARMQTIAFITEARVIRQILDSVGFPGDSPQTGPVTIPQQLDLEVT